MKVNKLELFIAITQNMEKQGADFSELRLLTAILEAASLVADAMDEEPEEPAKETKFAGLDEWMQSDDTGASSLFMASVLGGFERPYCVPVDYGDFRRCNRLLAVVPEFHEKLKMMRGVSKAWENLVDKWHVINYRILRNNHEGANRLISSAIRLEQTT